MRQFLWALVWLLAYTNIASLVMIGLSYAKETSRMIVPLHRMDVEVLARTLYGEGRGEGIPGMEAIAWVVVNRVRRGPPKFPSTIAGVCKQPFQFSCFNSNDPNAKLCAAVSESDEDYLKALFVATSVLLGKVPDPTGFADHYHATSMKKYPDWAAKMYVRVRIGRHIFYSSERP